jgi:branched-chain amino acid transport system permease protein
VAQLIFGSNPKMFNKILDLGNIELMNGELNIPVSTLVMIATSLVIVVGLSLFIKKTKTGRAMLAVSEDKDAARLMGINVNKTITITFAIGSALAAIASFLMFNAYPGLVPTSGSMPGIKAFIAAVFGGIGSIPGAMIGGIILGIIEILSGAYISTQLANAIVFLVLIVVLIFKPTGLLGKKIKEKV